MRSFTGRGRATVYSLMSLCALVLGCESTPSTNEVISTEVVSKEPGEILLSDPQVTMTEPNRVRFEVHYQFTRGKPDKHYMCEITFPGTTNHASKQLDNWALQSEGVIRDGFRLTHPPVTQFEIRVLEAESPQNGYKLISNVVSGTVGGK